MCVLMYLEPIIDIFLWVIQGRATFKIKDKKLFKVLISFKRYPFYLTIACSLLYLKVNMK